MKMTLVVPPTIQTLLYGYRGSLTKSYYGKEYEFRFLDSGCEVYRDSELISKSAVEAGEVPTRLLVAVAEAAKSYNLLVTENA